MISTPGTCRSRARASGLLVSRIASRALVRAVLATAILITSAALVACEPGLTVIPPGAQEVHVEISGLEVHLQPATVEEGDVYLVVDSPGGGPVIVSGSEGGPGGEAMQPLSEDALARLAQGNTYLMTISAGYGTGKPHGNVHKLTLAAGRYAFLADSPERLALGGGGTIPQPQLTILEVLPGPGR